MFVSFAGRDHGWITDTLNPLHKGVAYSDYTSELRRTKTITLGILRNLGYGKSDMDQKIQVFFSFPNFDMILS